ncbi:MAG: hypothetical protein H6620_12305 [Halobacteriovoraceae bacterium]|nr:hypothetical protein [Halobacteriovoraceae bacterium]
MKVPFVKNNLGVCFDVRTDFGMLRLWLDTGCTMSLVKPSRFPKTRKVSGKARFGLPIFSSIDFTMNGHQMGPIEMLFFDIGDDGLLSEIDGILGVDFLKKYVVYLDFENSIAYLAESS